MPIRKHGRTWEVRLQSAGQRISRSFGSRADAAEFERRTKNRIADNRVGRTPSYSLEEAIVRWLSGEALALKSYEDIKSKVALMYPHCAGRALAEVGDAAAKVKADGLNAGLMPATINRRLAILIRVAKLAYKEWGWLDNDLGAKIRLLPGERKRSEYITVEQAKKLLEVSSGKIHELIRWALLTGLRRGELLSLTPASFRDGAVHLQDTKSGKPRAVPLLAELDPKTFPFGMGYSTLDKLWFKARSAAGLPHIRFHDLRRSFGTWLHQEGADLAAIRDLFGHSTIAQTSTYLGVSSTDLQRAVAKHPGLKKKAA